jgi:TolA-binding protein
MNCQELDRDELVEKYLRNQLDSTMQDDFEIHILECPRCLQTLEALQAVEDELAQRAPEIRTQHPVPAPRFQWKWTALAAMLFVAGGVGVLELRHSAPKQARGVEPDLRVASGSPPSAKTPHGDDRADGSAGGGVAKLSPGSHDLELGRKAGIPNGTHRASAQVDSQTSHESSFPNSNPLQQQAAQNPPDPAPGGEPTHTPLAAVTAGIGNNLPSPPNGSPKTAGDESAKELFRLGLVQPPPYTFSGFASSSKGPKASQAGTRHESGLGAAMPSGDAEQTQPSSQGRTYFQNAMDAYVEKRYADAIELLEADLELEPNAPDTNFFLGICRLMQAKPADAIAALKMVAGSNKSAFAQSAHFYLAKAYIQTGELAKAETELRATAAIPGRLGAEARSLLTKLEALRERQ